MQSNTPPNRYKGMSKRKNKSKKPAKANKQNASAETEKPEKAKNAKQQSTSAKPTGSAKAAQQGSSAKPLISRRNALRLLIGVPIVGAAGAAIHQHDVKTRGQHDLSLIGQGSPVVVQIHDPSCKLCRRLMRNTREALKNYSGLHYRVADVTTTEGKAFQEKHNVQHVTLLVFNGKGRLIDTIQGVTPVDELDERFAKAS